MSLELKVDSLSRGELIKIIVRDFHLSGKEVNHFKKDQLVTLLNGLIQIKKNKEHPLEEKKPLKESIKVDNIIDHSKVGDVVKELSKLKITTSQELENPFQSPKPKGQKGKKYVSLQIDEEKELTTTKKIEEVPKNIYMTTKQSEAFKDGYIEKSILGEGTYGKVIEIERKSDKKHFALKQYFDFIDCNEIDVLSKFDHPNLLRASDRTYNESKNEFNLFLPLGKTSLQKYIDKNKNKSIPIELICSFFHQLVSATLFLHENGYYHCDIKPANILLFETNEIDPKGSPIFKLVLADFGLVYPLESKIDFCGTFTYTSPQALEQDRKDELIDYIQSDKKLLPQYKDYVTYFKENINFIQADIYSIGTTILNCLRGKNFILYNNPIEEGYKTLYHYAYGNMNKETDPLTKECYKLVLSMIEPSQTKRMKSLHECFSSSLFQSKGFIPIKGKVIIPPLLSSNIVCNTILKTDLPSITMDNWEKLFKYAIDYLKKTVGSSILLMYSVVLTLLYRCLQYDLNTFFHSSYHDPEDYSSGQKVWIILAACIVCSEAIIEFRSDYTISNLYNKFIGFITMCNSNKIPKDICFNKMVKEAVFRMIVVFNGIIRIPTLYDESTKTPQLIVRWLELSTEYCEVLLMDKKEFILWHDEHFGENAIKSYLIERPNQTVYDITYITVDIDDSSIFELRYN